MNFEMENGVHRLGLIAVVLLLSLHGSTVNAQADSTLVHGVATKAPVILDGDTLFFISTNLGPFTPQQRATQVSEKLRSIIRKGKADSVVVVEMLSASNIVVGDDVLMAVTDDDAALAARGRTELTMELVRILKNRVDSGIHRYTVRSMLINIGITAGLLLVLGLFFWMMAKLFPGMYRRLESWEGTVFRPVRFRSQQILRTEHLSAFFIVLAKGIRLAISLLLLYIFIIYSLSLFPWTQRWDAKPILFGVFFGILTTIVGLAFARGLSSFFLMLLKKVDGWRGTLIKPVKLKTVEILSEERIAEMVKVAFRIVRMLSFLGLGYFYVTILFSLFEFTQTWAGTLFGYIINPLWNVLTAFVGYLPNLFFILVIAYVTRYVIKFVRLVFDEIGKGTLTLPGFFREWADPTYKIVRFMILAFAGIVIFPYLPGSSSPVFQGVSVFLGILFSLGSTSAIANVVAGVVLTYMRPFRIGDRVKIADTIGDIMEKTLLVTRVRTIKNVDITIPNAMVLGSHIINFSSSAKDPGLILHTDVTIGYDAPWKTVHKLLIAAAEETRNILKEPKPFVLQTSLDDFYVSYELNAYTDQPNIMSKTYSELHQSIQNKFNEAGVEIMSPHYSAVRDGNQMTIPENYLPKSYQAPGFRIFPFGQEVKKPDESGE